MEERKPFMPPPPPPRFEQSTAQVQEEKDEKRFVPPPFVPQSQQTIETEVLIKSSFEEDKQVSTLESESDVESENEVKKKKVNTKAIINWVGLFTSVLCMAIFIFLLI